MAKKKQLKITQVRSLIGRSGRQRRNMEALGIKRMNHEVVHQDTPQIRGMINKVQHLVRIEEVS